MKCAYKVYESQYVLGVGTAVVIVTAETARNGAMRSEFYVILRKQETCEYHQGVVALSPTNATAPLEGILTDDFIATLGKEQAQNWLDGKLQGAEARLGGLPDPFVLQEQNDGRRTLLRMRLLNQCPRELARVVGATSCAPLAELVRAILRNFTPVTPE